MYLTEMEAKEERLICHFPGGILSVVSPCAQTAGATVLFSGVDWDSSFVYLFDGLNNIGTSSVTKAYLKDFLPHLERLEIIDETYGYWQAKWKGMLTKEDNLVECMIEICYSGEMVYEIEEI